MSPKQEEEEAACPICGKMVSLEVAVCPHCGAEFEEEEVEEEEIPSEEEEVEEAVEEVDDDETAACPICGKMVSLAVSCCPNCGAEFEEEEVEEIIEIEERQVPKKVEEEKPKAKPKEKPKKKPPKQKPPKGRAPKVEAEEPGFTAPTSLLDLKVIGFALIILGIVGAQVAFMIDWYWSWVPPIEDNIALFAALPVVVLIVGILLFMLVKKLVSDGTEVPGTMSSFSLSLFIFGILGLIVMLLWSPINSALQDSQVGVGGGFVIVLIVGILLLVMGPKLMEQRAAA